LRELIMPSRSRDSGNTVMGKRFPGGQLILIGANSAVGLRSMPARWVFLDEVDAYPGDIKRFRLTKRDDGSVILHGLLFRRRFWRARHPPQYAGFSNRRHPNSRIAPEAGSHWSDSTII